VVDGLATENLSTPYVLERSGSDYLVNSESNVESPFLCRHDMTNPLFSGKTAAKLNQYYINFTHTL